MSEQISTKTFVRGAYLFSTQDGTGFEQKDRNRVESQIIIQDKGNLGGLKRQIQSKRQEISKKKQKAKKQKQMLIPIRDTPVEPLPQPTMDNNKCERATQQQFQYFQTYISQKQKQRKFYEQQNRKIDLFEKQQERYRINEQKYERKNISIVFEKEDPISLVPTKNVLKKKGPVIKVVIKKKQQSQGLEGNLIKKQNQKNNNKKHFENQQKDKQFQGNLKKKTSQKDNKNQNEEQEEDYEQKRKIRVLQQDQE